MSVSVPETSAPATGPDEADRGPFPSPDDLTLPPDDRDLGLAWRIVGIAVVLACCAVVFWQLDPGLSLWSPNRGLLLRDTTPSGGDMGAHVWFPAYLRDHLLPRWRVAGWAPDWFGGFPAGQFYFPLPALLIVVLDLVMPYNVAFKLVTAIGPVALPATVYAFGRGLRVRRPGPELMAVGATCFLFFRGIEATAGTHDAQIQFNQRIMGGTLASALAGEYSFSFALALAFAFLGALAYSLRTRRRLWLPALLLAGTILSHVVVGIFAAVAAVVVWAFLLRRRQVLLALGIGAAIGGVGAALSAFWTFPLLAGFGYTANMRYERLTWYLDYLIPGQLWWVFVLAAIGVLIGLVRVDRAVLAIASVTVVFAVVFRFWPELHAWNLRFLPFWYLGAFLLAGIAVAEVVRGISSLVARAWTGSPPEPGEEWAFEPPLERRRFRLVRSVTALGIAAVVTVGSLAIAVNTRKFLDFWAQWNYAGYEDTAATSAKPKAYAEYRALIETMRDLPPGLAMWEGGPALDAYGTPLALMLLPYWTDGRIDSLEGLFYESAASTPYDFMAIGPLSASGNASNPVRGLDYRTIGDFDVGVRYLEQLGARYYLAHSDDAKARADAHRDLRLVAKVPGLDATPPTGWNVYEVRDHARVAPLAYEPVVVAPTGGRQSECFGRPAAVGAKDPELDPWECVAAEWWDSPERLDQPLAASGPKPWRRASAGDAASVSPRRLPEVRVTDVRETEDSVAFRVSRVGVPVVVRTSYFPAWKAHGADGPWRLTPNLMVVVPTERSVTLRYERTGAEWLGIVGSLAGLAGLVALVVWRPRTRPSRGGTAEGLRLR